MVTIIHSVQEIALPLFPLGTGALGVGTPFLPLGFPTALKGKVASVLDAT